VKEKERGGEGPITKTRKVDNEQEGGDVMPSRSYKSKKRTEMEVENVDSNLTHAAAKKKTNLKRVDGDGHATTVPAPGRRNEQITAVILQSKTINPTSLSTIYSSVRGRRRRQPFPHCLDPPTLL
jgi:hypothetical protein